MHVVPESGSSVTVCMDVADDCTEEYEVRDTKLSQPINNMLAFQGVTVCVDLTDECIEDYEVRDTKLSLPINNMLAFQSVTVCVDLTDECIEDYEVRDTNVTVCMDVADDCTEEYEVRDTKLSQPINNMLAFQGVTVCVDLTDECIEDYEVRDTKLSLPINNMLAFQRLYNACCPGEWLQCYGVCGLGEGHCQSLLLWGYGYSTASLFETTSFDDIVSEQSCYDQHGIGSSKQSESRCEIIVIYSLLCEWCLRQPAPRKLAELNCPGKAPVCLFVVVNLILGSQGWNHHIIPTQPEWLQLNSMGKLATVTDDGFSIVYCIMYLPFTVTAQ
ncbi:hypothetical protein J6590_023719 [Homalodisca vitripennis]|nr:hypothetical protein J6590_023719 [Homalodisca vitripennis]